MVGELTEVWVPRRVKECGSAVPSSGYPFSGVLIEKSSRRPESREAVGGVGLGVGWTSVRPLAPCVPCVFPDAVESS